MKSQKSGSNFLYGNEALDAVLAADAKVFYFDGKKCAEDPKVKGAQLEYSAQIGKL